MEGAPPQYTAKTLDDYLEHMSKPVFQAGISWRVVDAKWPTIRSAFKGFKTERVARMSDRDVDALVKDERVIRSRPKIAAVVTYARSTITTRSKRICASASSSSARAAFTTSSGP